MGERLQRVQAALLILAMLGAIVAHVLPWWQVTDSQQSRRTYESYPYHARDFGRYEDSTLHIDVVVTGVLLTLATVGLALAMGLEVRLLFGRPVAFWLRVATHTVPIVFGVAALVYTVLTWSQYLAVETSFWDSYTMPFERTSREGIGWTIAAVCLVALPLCSLLATIVTGRALHASAPLRRKRAVLAERP